MKLLNNKLDHLLHQIVRNSFDDTVRKLVLIIFFNFILMITSIVMGFINLTSNDSFSVFILFLFAFLCALNVVFLFFFRSKLNLITTIFMVEGLSLLGYFTIIGFDSGASVLWYCVIPSIAVFVFGRKWGSIIFFASWLFLIFFFWIPIGESLLLFNYHIDFRICFPILLFVIHLFTFAIETIRAETKKYFLKKDQEYRYMCRHDELTGIFNRYGFHETLKHLYRSGTIQKTSILIIDIDDFKYVNDNYGHSAGDQVLKNIANHIKDLVCPHAIYSRCGGEEFIVWLNCEDDAMDLAERIRADISKLETIDNDKVIRITVSIGIGISKISRYEDLDIVIRQADKCLYEAKNTGKNKIILKEITI